MAKRNRKAADLTKAAALVDQIAGSSEPAPEGFAEVSYSTPLKRPGDVVIGTFQGAGPVKLIRKKEVGTFRILKADGVIVDLLASAQIVTFFESIAKGDSVWIKREGTVEGGKGRVNTYRFAVKRAVRK